MGNKIKKVTKGLFKKGDSFTAMVPYRVDITDTEEFDNGGPDYIYTSVYVDPSFHQQMIDLDEDLASIFREDHAFAVYPEALVFLMGDEGGGKQLQKRVVMQQIADLEESLLELRDQLAEMD